MPRKARPLAVRLEQNTEQLGNCVVWTGTTNDGYGTLWIAGKMQYVARLAYQHYFGSDSVPEGMVVSAMCGNKLCIAPAHLQVVTRAAATERGFQQASRQPQLFSDYKLHLWERAEIVEQAAAGVSVAVLAREHQVSAKTIRRVLAAAKALQAAEEGRAVKTNRAYATRCVLCREEFEPTSSERVQWFHHCCWTKPDYAEVVANKQLMRLLIAEERANRKERTAVAVSADDLIDAGLL